MRARVLLTMFFSLMFLSLPFLSLLFLSLLMGGGVSAAVVDFQQVDWLDEVGGGVYTSENSDWGRMGINLEEADVDWLPFESGLGYVGYLNVITTVPSGHTGNWAVENLVLAIDDTSQAALDDRGERVCLFDLGVTAGVDVANLQYYMVISDEAQIVPPSGSMSSPVGVSPFEIIKGGIEGTIPGSIPSEDFLGGSGKNKPPPGQEPGQEGARGGREEESSQEEVEGLGEADASRKGQGKRERLCAGRRHTRFEVPRKSP